MKRDVVTFERDACKLINKQVNYELTEIDERVMRHGRKKLRINYGIV